MIRIGSTANKAIEASRKEIFDSDYMCNEDELNSFLGMFEGYYEILNRTDSTVSVKILHYNIIEFFIGKDNNSTEQLLKYCNNVPSTTGDAPNASIHVQYCLKMSHRFLRNSPHFLKTMKDIQTLRGQGAVLDDELQAILELREKETYNYKHPDLSVSKKNFFNGDDIDYVYDHDTIHEAIAIGSEPAYKKYMRDGSEVMTCKEKFFAADEMTRLLGVYEEACVLALERSQIPFNFNAEHGSTNIPTPKDSFIMALIKVCTSITSGWFRSFAWEHFHKIIHMYRNFGEDDYVNRFRNNFSVLKPFENGMVY